MADIREHLQADLETRFTPTPPAESLVAGVSAGVRPQASELSWLVWRCTKGELGEDLGADDGTRTYQFELVIWAADLPKCIAIKNQLLSWYHAPEGYDFGIAGQQIEMGSSRLIDEYDGDRVTETYNDNGALALTTVFEFQWVE